MAYLHDRTRLLANPGLRPGVRDDVAAVSGIVQHWKQQQLRGKLRKYTVRRYVHVCLDIFWSNRNSSMSKSFSFLGMLLLQVEFWSRFPAHRQKILLIPPADTGIIVPWSFQGVWC